eukprot:Sdes_comp16030_c0_seq1m5218
MPQYEGESARYGGGLLEESKFSLTLDPLLYGKKRGELMDESKVAEKIRKCKREARSELDEKEWEKNEYSREFSYEASVQDALFHENVERISYDQVSCAEFSRRFEETSTPCVIVGGMENWGAPVKWTPDWLLSVHGHKKFKVGEDDDGDPVKLRLCYFFHYLCSRPRDDSPLYIFDSHQFEPSAPVEHEAGVISESAQKAASLLDRDFSLPKYFTDDLFQTVGHVRRPPYRWFVVGPARSGTGIHVDPLGTSAWNALLRGHKRWMLFEGKVAKRLLKPPRFLRDAEAATWFSQMLPIVRSDRWEGPKPVEILQKPGEIVFVPGGWWHVVLNLDFTVAVTQNFVSFS